MLRPVLQVLHILAVVLQLAAIRFHLFVSISPALRYTAV